MPVLIENNVSWRTIEPYFVEMTRRVARGVSCRLRINVRKFIPQHLGDKKGAWKGWETSGELYDSIVVGGDKKWGAKKWKAKVRVERGSKANIYAGIHETGNVIFAHNSKGYMRFRGLDQSGADMGILYRKFVVIKKKAFFAQGRALTMKQMDGTLERIKRGEKC